jgi:hypothetical protein
LPDRASADFLASLRKYAFLAFVAHLARSSGASTLSGSTCFSNRSRNAFRAGAVRGPVVDFGPEDVSRHALMQRLV